MTDTKSISIAPNDMTDEGVNIALKPLLEKLQAHLEKAFPHIVTKLTNDTDDRDEYDACDGMCLSLIYDHDTTYKVLGSEWHSRTQLAFLNVAEVGNPDEKAYRGKRIERAEIDGSKDLTAEFLDWYDWIESVATHLLEGNH